MRPGMMAQESGLSTLLKKLLQCQLSDPIKEEEEEEEGKGDSIDMLTSFSPMQWSPFPCTMQWGEGTVNVDCAVHKKGHGKWKEMR